MPATPSALPTAPAPGGAAEILVVLDAGDRPLAAAAAESARARLAARFPGRPATVLATSGGAGALVDPVQAGGSERGRALAGPGAALAAALREAERRAACATVLVSGGARDETVDWLGLLLEPILDASFDCVLPAYRRGKLDGLLSVAILQPLTRALYGRRLRQPSGREAALSPGLARALLADPDWRRAPASAGSGAWLLAKALPGPFRTCTAWLGAMPQASAEPETASQALARVVEPLFHEMERHAERWQRVERSEPVPSFGQSGTLEGAPATPDAASLADAFRLGLRELGDLWGLVLPPAALLALRRSAALRGEAFRLPDALWARIVYDFSVAHSLRTVERQQLLRSMTPLYLGWVAGFVSDVRTLDGPATDARAEALCQAFEQEKPYAIARWRWPDGFNP